MSTARDAVLSRIRHALAGVPDAERRSDVVVERAYRRHGDLDPDARVALFVERVGEYRATVERCAPDAIAGTVGGICAARDVVTLLVPPDVPGSWRPAGVRVVVDDGHPAYELDRMGGVLTGCAVAIAETGTIVLDGAEAQGRRALTLVPDVHICVVAVDQVVALVTEATAALRDTVHAGRPLTMISGPSATSDIELSRVEGVHGPRRLHVLVVD